ncbi:MAG: CAP domain-containing protein [Pseudomonadota bacterium]
MVWLKTASFFCMALALTPQARAQTSEAGAATQRETMRVLSQARLKGCEGRPGAAGALRDDARLSVAAAGVADGKALDDAIRSAGYPSLRATVIVLRGASSSSSIGSAAVRFSCKPLTDPELVDAGLHRRGSQTWILLAAPLLAPEPSDSAQVQARLLELVNQARRQARDCGDQLAPPAPPLRLNAKLSEVAAVHARDMAAHSYFSHTGRDGSHVSERADRLGYRWRSLGENIAAGQARPEAAVEGWLKSPEHCRNLMMTSHREMGVAFAVNPRSEAVVYWVQVFGVPR